MMRMMVGMTLLALSSLVFAETSFETGVKLFSAGQYDEAARAFEKAKRDGDRSLPLRYNLGVVYFKLADYARAAEHFRYLLNQPGYQELANYNLALVYVKQGKQVQANRIFSSLAIDAKDKKLRELAQMQLQEAATPTRDAASGTVQMKLGSDSNVNFDPIGGPASEMSDTYTHLYAAGKFWLRGTERDGYNLKLTYSDQSFSTLSHYDLRWYKAELEKSLLLSGWLASLGLGYDSTRFGGQDYLSTLLLDVQAKRGAGKDGKVYLTYRYSDVGADNPLYYYLEGNKQQLRMAYSLYLASRSYHTFYEYEDNDRTDSATRSYSPLRHTFAVGYYRDINTDWLLQTTLAYRMSEYPALAATPVRNDDRLKLDLGLTYRVTKQFRVEGEYVYTKNDSSDPQYHYDRNIVSLNAKYYF